MATLFELTQLYDNNEGLRAKVVIAAAIRAQEIVDEAAVQPIRLQWAIDTLANPDSRGNLLLGYVLGANSGAPVGPPGGILGATDAAIITNVNAAIDKIVPPGV
jgi:hypothetical protein